MTTDRTSPRAGSTAWQLTIAAATIAGTLATACMMPFVAVAAVTGATMPRRQAAVTIAGVWGVNQLIGFTVLDYPADPLTIAWGVALGVASLAAMMVAAAVIGRDRATVARLVPAFAAAFLTSEAALFCFAAATGTGTGTFGPGIIATLLLNEACWGAALVACHAVLTRAAPRTFGSPLGLAHA